MVLFFFFLISKTTSFDKYYANKQFPNRYLDSFLIMYDAFASLMELFYDHVVSVDCYVLELFVLVINLYISSCNISLNE